MATRQQVIQRARDLIQEHPSRGKDWINAQLKMEFGVGLRRSEVARLKRSIVTPTAQEQAQLVLRYQKLRQEGFLPEEARYYSQFPISKPGMRSVRRFRKSEVKQIKKSLPQVNVQDYIRESYKARGLVTPAGKLIPEAWNTEVYYELERKPKERRSVIIPPERYEFYAKARRGRIKRQDALRLAQRIPKAEWDRRSRQYNTLRKAHFSHWEALKITTTLTKADKDGKRYLQSLDLTNPIWKDVIVDRIERHRLDIIRFMSKGLTRTQAENAFQRELNQYYKGRAGDTRDDATPWDWLREYYKIKGSRPKKDYIDPKERREIRLRLKEQAKKKMPYSVR